MRIRIVPKGMKLLMNTSATGTCLGHYECGQCLATEQQ